MKIDSPEQTRVVMTHITQPRRLLTVDDYHAMGEAGILRPEERVELIGGEIIEMSPQGSEHAFCVRRLNRLLMRLTDVHGEPIAEVSVQAPIVLGEHWEPEPDLALIRVGLGSSQLPAAGDVLLLVEVSDTTLSYDVDVKVPAYAEAGIPEVWIVSLPEDVVRVYRTPRGRSYRKGGIRQRGQRLDIETLPELGELNVEDVLPPK